MFIGQLRGTIFAPLNIGYTPETYKEFCDLLLPGAKALSANQPEMIVPGFNPNMPQYGLPWRLFKKAQGDEGDYNIVFLPGKIDIIYTKDTPYGTDTEEKFCELCTNLFNRILAKHDNLKVTRIAYAPLYAVRQDADGSDYVWSRFIKRTAIDGIRLQDVNFSFLLKKEIEFNGRTIQMNLLHNISDGVQIKHNGSDNTTQKVVLLQLDLNSIPEQTLTLDSNGVKDFFKQITKVRENLVDNVAEQ